MRFDERLAELGFDTYDEYLRSPGWKRRRDRAMGHAGGKCPCGARATDVHHVTYARLGHESKSDLRPVCVDCHAEIHARVKSGTPLRRATREVLELGHAPKRRRGATGGARNGSKSRKSLNVIPEPTGFEVSLARLERIGKSRPP